MNIFKYLGEKFVSLIDYFLLSTTPWKPGTVLTRTDRPNKIWVVVKVEKVLDELSSREVFYSVKMLEENGKIAYVTVGDSEVDSSTITNGPFGYWKMEKNP